MTAPCTLRAARQRRGWCGAYQPAARGVLDSALHIGRHAQGGEQMMRLSNVQGGGFTLALTLGEFGQSQMRAADFEARRHGGKGGECLVEIVFGLGQDAAGLGNTAQEALRPGGAGTIRRLTCHGQALEREMTRRVEVAAQEVSLAQQGGVQALETPVAELVQAVHRLLQRWHGPGEVTLFQIGVAQPPHGKGGIERIRGTFQSALTRRNTGLPLTAGGLDPASSPGGKGLQPPVGSRRTNRIDTCRGLQGLFETSQAQGIESQHEVGHAQPLILPEVLQDCNGALTVLHALRRMAHPVALHGQHMIGLAQGQADHALALPPRRH